MDELIQKLMNPWVLLYLVLVVIAAIVPNLIAFLITRSQKAKRRAAGLPDDTILGPGSRLEQTRRVALFEAGAFLSAVIVVPMVLWKLAGEAELPGAKTDGPNDAQYGLGYAFVFLLLWVLLSGTDVAKAFLGGMAFRMMIGLRRPFQVGDRVTLAGHSGRVDEIGLFHVRLTTANDDAVSIPTTSLWSQTLVSANAGDRASLCVMEFYLAPSATTEQRHVAEDVIWDATQASVYFDAGKPFQIYCTQRADMIQLTAKAYVGSTYKEPDFCSDVTSRVLDKLGENRIPLAHSIVHAELRPRQPRRK